jgi:hypothetical protein
MKNKIYLTIIITLVVNAFYGQVFTKDWANNTQGLSMMPLMIKPDPKGYFIMLSEGTTTAANNWILSKYNNAGIITYSVVTTLPASLYSSKRKLRVDKFGNVYVLMNVSGTGTVDIDPGPGVVNVSSGLNFIKYRNDFSPKWAKVIQTGDANPANFAIDSIGNLFIEGTFRNTVDFDPGTGISNLTATFGTFSKQDVFVAAYDSAGTYLWADRWGAKGGDVGGLIEVNPANNDVYLLLRLVGENSGDMTDIDPGPATLNVFANYMGGDNYLVRLNGNGTFLNYKASYIADATTVDPSGNLYLWWATGGNNWLSKLDPSLTGQYTVTPLGGNAQGNGTMDIYIDSNYNLYVGASSSHAGGCTSGEDFYIGKINATTGALIGMATFLGSSSGACPFQAAGIITISGTEAILANYHDNSYQMDYDPGPGSAMLPSTTSFYGAVAKYYFCTSAPSGVGSITGNTSICPTSTNIYSIAPVAGATSYTWTKPGGWTGISTTNTISLTSTSSGGAITVSAINACGASVASTLVISIGIPTVTVSSSNSMICTGNSATLTAGGALSYTWQPGNLSGSTLVVSPASNTTFTVLGSSGGTCTNTAVTTISVNNTPTVNAGSSQTITCAQPSVNLSGSGVSSYTWSGPGIVSGSNSASPVVNVAGTYSLVGSTSGCNSNTASVIVSSDITAPTIVANSSSSLICGPPFQGTATISASGAITFTWSTSAVSSSISVSPATTTSYTVTGTAANGCTNTATFTQSVSACTNIYNLEAVDSDFVIYPNPTDGIITVVTKNKTFLEVYNALGERIQSLQTDTIHTTIDLNEFTKGIYFVKAGILRKKVVKQ